MSAKAITYNSHDFQDANFRTKDIIYRNLPEKVIDIELKARKDGFLITNAYYSSKDISISGTLTRDTEANLRTSIDSMKESLHVDEANLDIDDGGSTIRYVASVASIDIPEEHYHITQVPYRITFRCQPFGHSTSSVTSTNSITSTPYSTTINPTGSAPPSPSLKWTCDGAPTAAITQIVFTNTTNGDSITIPSLVLDANGDYLVIDTNLMTVKKSYDGGAEVDVDFTGIFPRFNATSNSYSVAITGGGATWALDQEIVYFPAYL